MSNIEELDHRTLTSGEFVHLGKMIRADPVFWAKELFGCHLWSKADGDGVHEGQAEIVESVFRNQRTAAPTGHSIGKTHTVGILTALWLISHAPNSYVIITASTWTNIENKIFGETIKRAWEACKLPFKGLKPGATTWKFGPGWMAVGISPDNAETAQSWHSDQGTLVIADEASSLPLKVYIAFMSLLTSPRDACLLLGNPLYSTGVFADAILGQDEEAAWHVIHVSTLHSPNVVHQREVIPGLATQQWVNMMKAEYGDGSPEFNARVLGLVPDQDDLTYISRATVREAGGRELPDWHKDGSLILGVDVARSPVGDQTIFTIRGDQAVHFRFPFRGLSEPKIISMIQEYRKEYGISKDGVFIDATGIGSGLCDQLIENFDFPASCRVLNGASADNPVDYVNRKSEQWGRMKQWLANSAIAPALLPLYIGRTGLCTVQYAYNGNDQLKIEPKDKYKERIGKSPDESESLALTFAQPIGEPVFPAATPWHILELAPSIINGNVLHLEEYSYFDAPGELVRATWFSRRDSACVWGHVDDDGDMVIWQALQESGMGALEFWRKVITLTGENDDFRVDVFSTLEDSTGFGREDLRDALYQTGHGDPRFLPSTELSGKKGIEVINGFLLGALARDEHNGFWAKREREPFLIENQLYAVEPVVTALRRARYRPEKAWDKDREEDRTETLIGGGGAYVRALRLLVQAGAT